MKTVTLQKRLLALSFLIVFITQTLSAQTIMERALRNYNRATSMPSANVIIKRAEAGDAESQYDLAVCFEHGKKGIKRDKIEAVKWYTKAAEQDHIEAQYRLGWCYFGGRGVLENKVEAAKWWQKAAEQGYAEAQFRIGNCYNQGRGVEQNFEEAAKWYMKAAEQKNGDACYSLALMYTHGRGVPQDYNLAAYWMRIASENGHITAGSKYYKFRLHGYDGY